MIGAVRQVNAALWVVTALGVISAAGLRIEIAHVPPPVDALESSLLSAFELLRHNAVIALWPAALAGLGWATIPIARLAADVIVAGQLVVHGLLVGDALGQRPELWRYLPHLPLEWLGIAAPVAAWRLSRSGEVSRKTLLCLSGASVVVLAIAAVIETWAVPL